MSTQVSKVASSCFYSIYNIRRIRKYIPKEVCKTLVNALVTSRLDYCNSLCMAVPQYSWLVSSGFRTQPDLSTTHLIFLHHLLYLSTSTGCLLSFASSLKSSPLRLKPLILLLPNISSNLSKSKIPTVLSDLLIPSCSSKLPYRL